MSDPKSKPTTAAAKSATPTARPSRRPSASDLLKPTPPAAPATPAQAASPPDDGLGEPQETQSELVLTIRVVSARNVKGAKGDKLNSFVRVQFHDFEPKESPVYNDSPTPEYNFSVEQRFHVDETLIDMFANKKLHFTLIESLPKEKTAVLGDAHLSMYPHFLKYPPTAAITPSPTSDSASASSASTGPATGSTTDISAASAQSPTAPLSFRQTVPITYLNPRLLAPGKNEVEDPNKIPEFEVEVSISEPLIPPEVVEQGNFITLKVEDVVPVPDEWSLKEGMEKDLNSSAHSFWLYELLGLSELTTFRPLDIFQYTLNMLVPSSTTPERLVQVTNGTLTNSDSPVNLDPAAIAPQPIMLPKTPNSGSSNGGNGANGGDEKESSNGNAEDAGAGGEQKQEQPRATTGELHKVVSWGFTHVIWMPPEAVARLRGKIQNKQALEVEFVRELQPRFSHVTDTLLNKYRGRVVMDLAPLLYPRVIGLKGRWPLDVSDPPAEPTPFSAVAAAGESSAALDTVSTPKKGTKPSKEEASDENLYRRIGATLGMEMLLEKPLLDKKKLQPINKGVRDFIPRRVIPPHMQYEKRSREADEEYQFQVQDLVRRLIQEHQAAFALLDDQQRGDSESVVEMDEAQKRKRFLFHLNKSGAYFELKEHLKEAVVEIVRERFRRKSPFASKSELQLFISEVYVYLVDQMHIAINKIFHDKSHLFVDPTVSKTADFKMLKKFADAAELNYSVPIAVSYHQERLAKFEDSLQAWFDYGCFCQRTGMGDKGEECFKEILSRNSKHIPSLLAYGAVCCVNEKYEEARVYLVTAVETQPKYVLGLTMLALFYEVISEEEEAEKHMMEASNLHHSTTPPDAPSHFLMAAEFLIQCHAGKLAERALAQELILIGPRVKPYLMLSKLESQRGDFVQAEKHIRDALEVQQDDPDTWAALGHLQFIQRLWHDAQQSYETVLSLSRDPTDIALIYVRLGSIYLQNATAGTGLVGTPEAEHKVDAKFARMAKTMYLRACEKDPSSTSWLGAGKACLALGELDEAEDAFAEANVLNNRDSDVWANLALLCLRLDRFFEANQCIAQALRLGIKDPDVLRAVGNYFMNANQASPAIECFRMSLEIDPTDEPTRELMKRALNVGSQDFLSGDAGKATGGKEENEGFSKGLTDESSAKLAEARKNMEKEGRFAARGGFAM
ncbi:Cilia- and flagella-associated protein 70 [Rhizophlyctis rosea]|uniref:Cilia- and flagella-associated protein 70 n=1 Tax=Rhizophlyctis rosea TaxID=64517 RepID=A0AAD5SJ30_9FUNG|nr:Cilia- and flagella-associated protein 70 [Rhizophlyctis rosea]